MLSPRLTNCPECANIPSLLRKIDCKLAELGNNLYNNISYMLNKPVPADDILQLIGYRRILAHKLCNPNYVHEYSVAMIASRVIRLTVGCVSRCNEPEPCIEVPCDITIIPNPIKTTTTTSSSTSSTSTTSTTLAPTTTTTTTIIYNYNVASCERQDYFVIGSTSSTILPTGTIVSNNTPECFYVLGVTLATPDVGVIVNVYGMNNCIVCVNQHTTTTTSTTAGPTTTTTSSSSTSTTTSTSSSTTTTTTTIVNSCVEVTFIANTECDDLGYAIIQYTDCNGVLQTVNITLFDTFTFCSLVGSPSPEYVCGAGSFLLGGACTAPTTTTTSSSSSTTTTSSSTSSTSSTTTSTTTSPPFVNYQFNDYIRVVEVSSNDHPYVGGSFTMYGTTPASRIIKLNTDGTPDTSFVYGSGFNNIVWDILEQPDGKIVVVGQFTVYNGTPAAGIIRLNPNGTPDSSFIYGTGLTGVAGLGIRLAIQSDGKLIVGVQASQYNGTPVSTIMRLNPNGTFDNTFNLTVVQITANFFFPDRIIVDTNDKFFVSWNNSPGDLSINGNTSGLSMYKFNADGTTDTSFNVASTSIVYRTLDIILRPGGQILTGGQTTVRLYNSDGTLDSGFNIPTVARTAGSASVQSLGIDLNGNILAGGLFNSVNSITSLYNNIVRLQPDGTIDNTFIQGTGFDLTVLDIAETSDHKFYLGGSFIDYNNIAYYYLVRFNNNGTLDM